MSAVRESKGSDTFRFECDDCGATWRVRAHASVDAVLAAGRKGWTFAGRHDHCPRCKPVAKSAPRKGGTTRAKSR